MKILYDHLGFMERAGGVSRYYSKMIPNLDKDINYEVVVQFSSNYYLSELLDRKAIPFIRWNFPHKDRLYSELNKPHSINRIKKGDYDVYHMTHCDPYGFKYVPAGKKKVMTIHDLNLVMLPGIVRDDFSLKVWQKQSAQLVDAIVTVSENTKKDIIEQWNISPEKVHVIYHGVPYINYDVLKASQNLVDFPYVLYVGSRANFKNFEKLVNVFSRLKNHCDNLHLVCTGSPFSKKELDYFNALDVSEFVQCISVTDQQLYLLYYYALCYVYPSLYEGFGLPLLEAMACMCPVVCSNSSCFPEIAGNAAVFFDPNSEDEMFQKIYDLILSPAKQTELRERGFENIKRFSWEKSGSQHSDFYKQLY